MASENITLRPHDSVQEAQFSPARDLLHASYGLCIWTIYNHDPQSLLGNEFAPAFFQAYGSLFWKAAFIQSISAKLEIHLLT